MDELEEILYEYRLGLRELPTYTELIAYIGFAEASYNEGFDIGYSEGYSDCENGL